jgi:hypothetical protein
MHAYSCVYLDISKTERIVENIYRGGSDSFRFPAFNPVSLRSHAYLFVPKVLVENDINFPVKCLLYLPEFDWNWNVPQNFIELLEYQVLWKSVLPYFSCSICVDTVNVLGASMLLIIYFSIYLNKFVTYFHSKCGLPNERKHRFITCVNYEILVCMFDCLCGLVVRVLGYRSGGPGSIPSTTRIKK